MTDNDRVNRRRHTQINQFIRGVHVELILMDDTVDRAAGWQCSGTLDTFPFA